MAVAGTPPACLPPPLPLLSPASTSARSFQGCNCSCLLVAAFATVTLELLALIALCRPSELPVVANAQPWPVEDYACTGNSLTTSCTTSCKPGFKLYGNLVTICYWRTDIGDYSWQPVQFGSCYPGKCGSCLACGSVCTCEPLHMSAYNDFARLRLLAHLRLLRECVLQPSWAPALLVMQHHSPTHQNMSDTCPSVQWHANHDSDTMCRAAGYSQPFHAATWMFTTSISHAHELQLHGSAEHAMCNGAWCLAAWPFACGLALPSLLLGGR